MKLPALTRTACLSLATLLCVAVSLHSQSSNASISGVVTDSSNATVAGAQLNLQSLDSAAVSKATSSEGGFFSFPNLPSGSYQLKVSAKGFKDFIQTGIVLHLNDSVTLPVALEVGSASQTIEVNANASPLNFENGDSNLGSH